MPSGYRRDHSRVDGDGTSKSAASRRFVALSQQRLEDWLASDISKFDLLVIQIDGPHVAEDIVLIGAIGIDGNGDKHILGLVEGATESAAAAPCSTTSSSEGSIPRCRASSFSMERRRSRRRCAPHSAVNR